MRLSSPVSGSAAPTTISDGPLSARVTRGAAAASARHVAAATARERKARRIRILRRWGSLANTRHGEGDLPHAGGEEGSSMPTTIVHAADVHLETAFTELRGGARRRAALADAFVRVVDLAIERRADALTIGGDLYEAQRAGPQTARFIFAQLARFDGPVLVAPGNHDPYSARALYAREDRPPNVRVFAEPAWSAF